MACRSVIDTVSRLPSCCSRLSLRCAAKPSRTQLTRGTECLAQARRFQHNVPASRSFLPLSSSGIIQRPSKLNAAYTTSTATNGSAQQQQSSTDTTKAQEESKTTHFGFKTVLEDEKEQLVGKVFGNVAQSYDIMNDVMSFGIHRLWKDYFMRTLAPGPTTKLLDVAGGTGDIAFRFLEYVKAAHGDRSNANVTVVDINPAMLKVGEERAKQFGYLDEGSIISFQEGNAESLTNIPDSSVDCYTIAFGIRNCTHVDRVLSEAYRVLKPGGRFLCLEFGQVDNAVLKRIYDLYSFEVIPSLGQVVANDRDSYQYLVESIRKFPPQPQFAQMIKDAGFSIVGKGWEDLTFGVAAIHSGWKI
ncbi:2-hexaprenyl-6-methoxy-1,4-benzoquinone methyltransferase [Quaeritorhiza haematococci]|nr:2-hexaprenyl-6-methoxy-1,4-benzoquinone methyltransferase [Quaeritorhiza haematococci]